MLALFITGTQVVARRIGELELVAATLQAVQGCGLTDRIESLVQKRGPVIGLDGVERLDDVVESVGNGDRTAIVDAKESPGKVVERTLAC